MVARPVCFGLRLARDPDLITLAPGIMIPVPKARLTNSRDIWPLSGVKALGDFPEES